LLGCFLLNEREKYSKDGLRRLIWMVVSWFDLVQRAGIVDRVATLSSCSGDAVVYVELGLVSIVGAVRLG
jgi:hypothetical protein